MHLSRFTTITPIKASVAKQQQPEHLVYYARHNIADRALSSRIQILSQIKLSIRLWSGFESWPSVKHLPGKESNNLVKSGRQKENNFL